MKKLAYSLSCSLYKTFRQAPNRFVRLYSLSLLFSFAAVCIGQAREFDFSAFHNIDEVIAYETSYIENIRGSCYERLSDAYASRGESFLLCDRFDEALHDFQIAYDLALYIEDSAIISQLQFRALFGQAIVFAYLNEVDKVQNLSSVLMNMIPVMFCGPCQESTIESFISCSHLQNQSHFQVLLCEDTPIYGPDSMSIQDCIDTIKNTEYLCRLLIEKAPRIAQGPLHLIITELADAARNCCYRGGIWKGCIQSVVNKFHLWNQKWQVFRIPPDPAWD